MFENVNDFTIYGHGSHICHVTKHIFINFQFLVPKHFHMNLVSNGLVVSEKNKF